MSSNNLNKNNENLNNKNNVQKNSKKPINNSENKKKQTTNLIFLIIGIITLISAIILFTYEEAHNFNDFNIFDTFDNQYDSEILEDIVTTTTSANQNNSKSLKIYGAEKEYDSKKSIEIFNNVDSDGLASTGAGSKVYVGDYKVLATYDCKNSDCSLKNQISNDLSTVIIKDGNYLVYNFKTGESKNIDFGNYDIKYFDESEGNCFSWGGLYTKSVVKNGRTYYEISSLSEENGYVHILIDPDLKIVFADTSDEYNDNSDSSFYRSASHVTYLDNGNVVFFKNKKVNTYDFKTKKITSGKEYKDTLLIVYDYIGVVDNDDYLKVLDLKENEKAKLVKVTQDMTIHELLSGWYSQNKKEGVYFVVQDPNVTFNDLSSDLQKELGNGSGLKYGYEYYYIPSTGETGKIATYIGGYAKPVLYLYPKKDNTKVTVSFSKPNLLTTTYPKYKNMWEVTANKNGDLHDSDNKYYYGLYWEEEGSTKVDFKEGFYVTKDNAIEFLEEKLSILGLNDKEKNEFIMYWLPILEKNEKNLVYFELTNSREKFNKLIINPKPDSLLRIAIHIKKVDKKVDIIEEKLPTFKRKGFTAVEWGGVIH